MDPLAPLKAFDRFQQRHTPLAIPFAVLKKFGDDQAGNLAALVAYYAFFSLFPLLLVFVTVLGFVLQGHPSEITSVENSVLSNFPAFKGVIKFNSLHGSGLALAIGIATSLWSGLGVTGTAQNALDTVWAVPKKSRPNFIQSKLRGLALLASLGALFIIATLLSGIVTAGFGGTVTKIAGIAISFAANCVLFLASFRFMTANSVTTKSLRSGIVLAATFWTALQVLGGIYVKHVLKGLSSTYEQFGILLALLVWLHLGAQLTLYAAELNTVLERHLWPRSLFGPPEGKADKETLTALAKVEERHPHEQVDVKFSEPQPEQPAPAPADERAEPSVSEPAPRSGS